MKNCVSERETFIENPENKPFVDHISNNKLDNRIENLRWCTYTENNRNRGVGKNSKSGIKGVTWDKVMNKWKAGIKINGKTVHLGYHDLLEEAKQARQNKATEVFGDFLNKCEK
eukprot:gene23351-30261_t